jgi:hypothetical protein
MHYSCHGILESSSQALNIRPQCGNICGTFCGNTGPRIEVHSHKFFAFCEAIDFPLSMAVVNRSWNAFLALLALSQSSISLPSVVVSFSPLLETRAFADTNNNFYELNAPSLGLFVIDTIYHAAGHELFSYNYSAIWHYITSLTLGMVFTSSKSSSLKLCLIITSARFISQMSCWLSG